MEVNPVHGIACMEKPEFFPLNQKKWSTIFAWSFCFFFFLSPLRSQDNRIVFSHLDVNDGLSENWIKCTIRDRNGFIWFGTNTGLNRYDGYKFEVYLNNPDDSASIYDNEINAIAEDNLGNLWIGTRRGVNVLDISTYRFRRINLIPSAPLKCQEINYITALTSDSEGNIWIGTQNGLFFFNQVTKSTAHILLDEKSCSSPFNNITSIAPDKTGSVWIGTSNGYIFKYSLGSNSIEKLESLKHISGNTNTIKKLFVDNEGFLWIADSYGLYLFNIKERVWEPAQQQKIDPYFSQVQVSGIDQNIDDKIWITTDGNGLFIIDKKDFRISNLVNRPYATGVISSNGLISLYSDKSGIAWIGTAKKGVDFYKKNAREFQLIRNYPTEINSLSNNDVNCITEDVRGNLWIGTNGGGLNYLNRKTNSFTRYDANPGIPNSLSSNLIVTVFEDSEQKIWVGTFLGGLNCFDPETGKFTVYKHNDSDSTSLSDNRVWGICEDSRHNIWIATLTNGLNLFDRKTGKFRRYGSQNSSLCFNYLNSVSVDKNDNLWICSSNGLIFFNPGQNISVCYTNNPGSNTSISDNHISSVFEDSRGLFWVCTSNGLNLMDKLNYNFRVFREKDGLPSNSVLRMLEDNNSNLWISSKNGLSKLIIGKTAGKDSLSFRFVNYGMSDGLQGKEFNETAAFETRDGELWFGGPEGLNAFDPLEIKEDSSSSKLVITNFRIDNKIVRYGEVVNNRILLEKPIFNTDKIVLKYKENSFTIDFVALNYFFPEENRYAYNLEGFNDKWINTEGKENFATFSNIKNGNYTFKLKGTNSDGIWNESTITLKIKVLPPFWKSWYAYFIYFIMILSLLAFLRYLTLARERMNTQLEHEYIESRHIHEIDSMKIKFFTNISHEFRTPLTLILSPVEKLMIQWKNKPEEKYLNLILLNAKRLLFMVNQLLDFRKMEVQGFGYNPTSGNIVAFIEAAVSSFNDLSEQKHIQLVFRSDIKELNTLFDKDKLEKIMFNLLSNAFKFTPVDGKVSVTILSDYAGKQIDKDRDIAKFSHLIIKVEDTGIGIPVDKIDNLFISFYQADSAFSGDQGSGIGLSLVKEFVKLHDGEITVESEPGKGSCFTISLPVAINGRALVASSLQRNDDPESSYKSSILLYDTDSNNVSKEKPTLLIAEDNDDLRFYIKDNLQNQYNIYEAANGEEALAIILKIVPDLIISDIMMPGIDGIELCRRVKADKNICHIPLILLTARSTDEEQFECIETGADDCIIKPFNFQILEAKISNLIRIRRNLRQVFRNNLKIEPHDITITSLDEQFIHKVLDLVEKNISKTDYTVEELSRDLGMSRTLLYKKLLALTGKPPLEFIRSLRLKRAAQLLQKSQLHVSEIAFKVGFNDPKYFRKHFKNEFGVLPSRYSAKFKLK